MEPTSNDGHVNDSEDDSGQGATGGDSGGRGRQGATEVVGGDSGGRRRHQIQTSWVTCDGN